MTLYVPLKSAKKHIMYIRILGLIFKDVFIAFLKSVEGGSGLKKYLHKCFMHSISEFRLIVHIIFRLNQLAI